MRPETGDPDVNSIKIIFKISQVSSSTPHEMLCNAAGRQTGASRRLSFTGTEPTGKVFSDPIPKRTRGAAGVRATAQTFKLINNAASLPHRGRVFERTQWNPLAFPNKVLPPH